MWKHISDRWRALKISAKFFVAFGLLLVIGVLELAVSMTALRNIQNAEKSIQTSMEAQRLSLEMNRNWEEARSFQYNFFSQFPEIGYQAAYNQFALSAGGKYAEVVRGGAALKMITSDLGASPNLRSNDEALRQYLSAVGNYMIGLEHAVQMASDLDRSKTQLLQITGELHSQVNASGGSSAVVANFLELRLLEQEFLLNANPNSFSVVLNAISRLNQATSDSKMETSQKETTFALLDEYERTAGEFLDANQKLDVKLADLDTQADAIEPDFPRFTLMAQTEVIYARSLIDFTRRRTATLLILVNIAGPIMVWLIIFVLDRSIIRNIVKLTDATREMQAGDLEQRVQIASSDELGQLADTFNAMADNTSQMVNRLRLIHQASYEMARSFAVVSVLDIALDAGMQVSGAGSGFITLITEQGLGPVKAAGLDAEMSENIHLPGESVLDTWRNKTEQMTSFLSDGKLLDQFYSSVSEGEVSIPLVSRSKVIGVLDLRPKDGVQFQQDSLEFVYLLALRTALALDNARMYEEAQRLAVMDPLTNVFNRRGFFELCAREVARAARSGQPVSALFIDIDSFKDFNDRYSYDVGDLVLKTLANVVKTRVRNVDIVGRYGGEEFVVLLPDQPLEMAADVAERLRELIEQSPVETSRGALGVTISIGVATMLISADSADLESGVEELVLRQLFEMAGEMLHTAKAGGKNRVAAAERVMIV